MKTLAKKIIPYFLVLVILVISITNSYFCLFANASVLGLVNDYYDMRKNLITNFVNKQSPSEQETAVVMHEIFRDRGFIDNLKDDPLIAFMEASGLYAEWANIAEGQIRERTNAENIQAIKDMLANHVHFDDNNQTIKVDNQIINCGKKYEAAYINSDPMVGYSFDISQFVSSFDNSTRFFALKDLCIEYQDDYEIIGWNYYNTVALLPRNRYALLYNDQNGVACWGSPYSYKTWSNLPEDGDFIVFDYTNDGYVRRENLYGAALAGVYAELQESPVNYIWSGSAFYINYKNKYSVLCFHDLSNLKTWTVGEKPYYITQNWYDFSRSTGDYTLTMDNSNHTSYGDINNYISNYYEEHQKYPSDQEVNQYITNNNTTIINNYYYPSPTPTPGPGSGGTVSGNGSGGNTYVTNNYYVSGNVVPGSGNDPKTGKGIWDFLTELVSKLGDLINTIASSIGDVISALAALPGQILDFFTIDTEQVSAALSEATVSMNNLKNEVIPSEQIKSTIAPLNMSEIYYPKLTIKTPAIIRQYYDEEEIILLDFEKWAKYFVIVRGLLVFSFWFAFIYHTLASVRPHIDIGS